MLVKQGECEGRRRAMKWRRIVGGSKPKQRCSKRQERREGQGRSVCVDMRERQCVGTCTSVPGTINFPKGTTPASSARRQRFASRLCAQRSGGACRATWQRRPGSRWWWCVYICVWPSSIAPTSGVWVMQEAGCRVTAGRRLLSGAGARSDIFPLSSPRRTPFRLGGAGGRGIAWKSSSLLFLFGRRWSPRPSVRCRIEALTSHSAASIHLFQ